METENAIIRKEMLMLTKKKCFAILSLICAAMLLMTALFITGCDKTQSDSDETDASDVPMLSITNDFIILRSDTGSDDASDAAITIRKAIREIGAGEIDITTDWVKKGQEPVISPNEILVGSTTREESASVIATLAEHEYTVCMQNGKLVITGSDDFGTLKAAEYFVENYILGKDKAEVPMDINYKGRYETIYYYNIPIQSGSEYYDNHLTVSCLQGIFNRESDKRIYLNRTGSGSDSWLKILRENGRWLSDYGLDTIDSLEAYLELTRPYVKGVVIFDPTVPATVNLATTIAGVEDRVILSPDQYDSLIPYYEGLPVTDLRGMFDGSVTGSAKNDVYRWAIEHYLEKGLCSLDYLCYYRDTFNTRDAGDTAYVCIRDWAVYNRAFVYDLSPWGDEVPYDDPDQRLGLDLETYKLMLETQYKLTDGKQMTEVAGFFDFEKYANTGRHTYSIHEPVPTEWETVWLITPYNCFQNTTTEFLYNQSLHSQYELKPLTQNDKPAERKLENKTYISFLMADYDATFPLYFYLPQHWSDSKRGELPLAWGINPNLSTTYPDLIEYYYETRTENDYFVADASAAGYFNPNRVKEEHWDMVAEHNKKFYTLLDMSLSPMVLDWDALSSVAKDNFLKFSPDGVGCIIMDLHGNGGRFDKTHLWKGMPVDSLFNGFDTSSGEAGGAALRAALPSKSTQREAQFLLVRAVWTSPTQIYESVKELRRLCPHLDIEVVDMYTYFDLLSKKLS